jgi:BMFP domain-containing protein YqiC
MREDGAGVGWYRARMVDKRLFDELNERVAEALRQSPAADLEKNLRAMLASWFDRLELVSREDFDVQKKLLERAHSKLTELEARIAELESRPPSTGHSG